MNSSISVENRKRAARLSTFILVLSLLLTTVFAAVNVTDYLYPTESTASVQQKNTTVNGTLYKIVTVGGKETFVLKADNFVKNEAEIELAIKGNCFETSYPSATELSDISGLVLAFNNSRYTGTSFGTLEGYCDTITGQAVGDEGNCTSLQSCQIACNQGSYACFQYAQGSALFLPELLKYANVKRGIDANVTAVLSATATLKGISSSGQLTFNVSQKAQDISNSVTILQNLSGNYSALKLYIRSNSGGFEFCLPVGFTLALNNSALTSAASKASTIKTKAACFDTTSSKAKEIINSTLARIELYTGTKQKGSVQEQFEVLTSKFNNLTTRSASITALVSDENITVYVNAITELSAQYYSNVDAKLYDQAGLTVSSIDSKLTEFDAYLNASFVTLGPVVDARLNASVMLARASLLIESSDAVLSSDLKTQRDKFASLEIRVTAKISYNEIDTLASNYNTITSDTSSIVEKKRTLEAAAADNLLTSTARGISLAVLDVISAPFGVKESEKRAWIANIPLLVIAVVDILVLASFAIGFFFIVWRNTEKFMQSNVMKTWTIIFAFVFILLIGLSLGLNSLVSKETGQTSLFNYLNQAKKDNATVLFLERSSTSNAAAMAGCGSKIEQALTALGKTVTKIDVIDGVCNEKIVSECLNDVGRTPLIRLKYGSKNASSFYTFYKVEAVVEGDEAYFNECLFSKLIE